MQQEQQKKSENSLESHPEEKLKNSSLEPVVLGNLRKMDKELDRLDKIKLKDVILNLLKEDLTLEDRIKKEIEEIRARSRATRNEFSHAKSHRSNRSGRLKMEAKHDGHNGGAADDSVHTPSPSSRIKSSSNFRTSTPIKRITVFPNGVDYVNGRKQGVVIPVIKAQSIESFIDEATKKLRLTYAIHIPENSFLAQMN